LHLGQLGRVSNGNGKLALERFFKSRDSAGRKIARQEAGQGPRGCLEALADRKDGEKRLRQREDAGIKPQENLEEGV
jgi:hypothetical protein